MKVPSAVADPKPPASDDGNSTNSTSASAWLCASSNASSVLSKATTTVRLNGIQALALLDSGSTNSFIVKDLVSKLGSEILPSSGSVGLASPNASANIIGHCYVTLSMSDGTVYNRVCLSVLSDLCTEVILGQDFMRLHDGIFIKFGGQRPTLRVCSLARANVTSPSLFSNLLPNCKPVVTNSRRYLDSDKSFIREEIEKLLKEDVIEPSSSPWRAQVVVAKPENHKKRLVIDYSQTINQFTLLDAYPLPRINDLVETVSKFRVYSSLDLKSAYHQIPILDTDKPYTAFEANGNLYQFKRLPFGLTNAVAGFQRIMNDFIQDNGLTGAYAYLDNVLICGMDATEHNLNLKRFLEASSKLGFSYNDDKCSYNLTSIDFLGYTISNGTIRPDADRLRPLRDYPVPCNPETLRRAVGMLSYYSRWIPNFSDKIRTLSSCKSFPLSAAAIDDFNKLKLEIEAAVVQTIDENESFIIETDASDFALAATLSQLGRPVAFFSRTLSQIERRHPAVEKEAAAIVEAIRKWRHYLTGRHFTLVTDQRSISFMFDKNRMSRIKNDKILRWRIELAGYHYDIEYRPGKENESADAFSRVQVSASMASTNINGVRSLHERLCHPGVRRLRHYVRIKNLPYTTEEIKQVTSSCRACAELKPCFYKPPSVPLIKATQPFERLSMDFKGPLASSSRNKYMLTIVDEYSRFPFAFPCPDMTAATVKKCLTQLFSIFGMASSVHSDRGAQFMSEEVQTFLSSAGIASSRTSPYRPECNGQCERCNGVIWKAVLLGLRSRGMPDTEWEAVLPDALHSIRSLLCTATNETPHERLFRHSRKSTSGCGLPTWLCEPGTQVLLRRHVRSKADPLVDEVQLVHANPQYARVKFASGREDTVSIRDLAPGPKELVPEPVELVSPPTATLESVDIDTSTPPPLEKMEATQEPAVEQREQPELRRSTRERRKPERLTY